ncbi:MAG: hypothetical protein V1809_11100 [Planctomycetota bacterium]
MSDGQVLFAVLMSLCLSECLVWGRRRTVIFRVSGVRRGRVTTGDALFGNASGGICLLNPFSLPGRVFAAHLPPVSLAPDGVTAFHLQAAPPSGRPAGTGRTVLFRDVSSAAADGGNLVVNGERFAVCGSPGEAASLAEVIRRAARASVPERERILSDYLSGAFDGPGAEDLYRRAAGRIAPVGWAGSAFFIGLCVVTPALAGLWGLPVVILPAAAAMLLFATGISVMFWRAHRALYPDGVRDRVRHVVKMMLCPPTAVRAADSLSLPLLERYHPLVGARTLAGDGGSGFVRGIVRDWRYPLPHGLSDPRAAEIAVWFSARQEERAFAYLRRSGGTDPEAMTIPPAREGNETAYCPRCESRFDTLAGECPCCPGIARMPFPGASGGEEKNA